MAKIGFGGQWVEICKVGKVTDSTGVKRDLSSAFINQVIANYNATEHEAPAVIGHPEENAPAFGWVSQLRLNKDVLEAKFTDVPDEFEEAVRSGLYRKRSASFYLGDKPNLRHVGFLGAQPPAVKGLKNIQFSDGESITVEISFSEEQKIMSNENKDSEDKKKFTEWLKEFFGGVQQPAPVAAGFSEADQKKLIADAVKQAKEAMTSEFSEELKKRDDQITALTASVNAGSASGRRAEIVAFVEALPAERGKHFLKRAGIIEFLEACAIADEKDTEKAICFSEGEGDKKIEHKFSRLDWAKQLFSQLPPMIFFGENFGALSVNVDEPLVDPNRQKEINDAMGGND